VNFALNNSRYVGEFVAGDKHNGNFADGTVTFADGFGVSTTIVPLPYCVLAAYSGTTGVWRYTGKFQAGNPEGKGWFDTPIDFSHNACSLYRWCIVDIDKKSQN
jgi:hypothetical protein